MQPCKLAIAVCDASVQLASVISAKHSDNKANYCFYFDQTRLTEFQCLQCKLLYINLLLFGFLTILHNEIEVLNVNFQVLHTF